MFDFESNKKSDRETHGRFFQINSRKSSSPQVTAVFRLDDQFFAGVDEERHLH